MVTSPAQKHRKILQIVREEVRTSLVAKVL